MTTLVVLNIVLPLIFIALCIRLITVRQRRGTALQFGLREMLSLPIACLPAVLLIATQIERGLDGFALYVKAMILITLVGPFLYQLAAMVIAWLFATDNLESRLGWIPSIALVLGAWVGAVAGYFVSALSVDLLHHR